MKTINDIKCAEDMGGIAVDITGATKSEQKQLRGLCKLMEDDTEESVEFLKSERFFRLCANDPEQELQTCINLYQDETIIQLKDFLGKPKKEKVERDCMNKYILLGLEKKLNDLGIVNTSIDFYNNKVIMQNGTWIEIYSYKDECQLGKRDEIICNSKDLDDIVEIIKIVIKHKG